jgi:hypothetical protein
MEESVPVCDGCGARVDERHIRERIARLESATRFRPIHIGLLLIDAAPPVRPEDYFYELPAGKDARSVAGQLYFDELVKLVGAVPDAGPGAEALLADFQRRGFFLTSAVECPVDRADPSEAIRQLAPTVLRRVQTSYKPKHVVLISEPTRELIGPFRSAGWVDRLVLDGGAPFGGASLGERLGAAIARLTLQAGAI